MYSSIVKRLISDCIRFKRKEILFISKVKNGKWKMVQFRKIYEGRYNNFYFLCSVQSYEADERKLSQLLGLYKFLSSAGTKVQSAHGLKFRADVAKEDVIQEFFRI